MQHNTAGSSQAGQLGGVCAPGALQRGAPLRCRACRLARGARARHVAVLAAAPVLRLDQVLLLFPAGQNT